MSKRESLTESMRRLSNIVNEAEQLNEDPRKWAADTIQGAGKTAAGVLGKTAGEFAANRLKAKRDKQVSNSSRRQHENLEALTNSFTRELGEDPAQWAGKLKDYFADLREKIEIYVYKRDLKHTSMYAFPSPEASAHSHMEAVMGAFDKDFDRLVKACRQYARDPYSVEPQKHLSKTARDILEKVTKERPAAPTLPANHLNAVYEALAITKDKNFVPTGALKVLGVIMLAFSSIVALQIEDDIRREREREARRERYLRNQAISQGRKDQDFYGSDDDAPLSQGEQGYRDQDLLWGDDDDPNKY
jgi:hypothetical protein